MHTQCLSLSPFSFVHVVIDIDIVEPSIQYLAVKCFCLHVGNFDVTSMYNDNIIVYKIAAVVINRTMSNIVILHASTQEFYYCIICFLI